MLGYYCFISCLLANFWRHPFDLRLRIGQVLLDTHLLVFALFCLASFFDKNFLLEIIEYSVYFVKKEKLLDGN